MSVYYNKKLISGVREAPQMPLAEYNALTNKPDLWVRTDAPESDRGISASDIKYSTGVSVKDKIELIEIKEKTVSITTSDNQYVAPFTKAAVIQYDNELTKDTFISAYSTLTSSQIVMAYPQYIVFACNVAGTYDLTIKYSKGVQTT